MKKLLFALLLGFFLTPLLSAQSTYNGVIDDVPIQLVVNLNSSDLGAKIRYFADPNFISLTGTRGNGYAPESRVGNGDFLILWNEEEQVSIFLRDVSSAFDKPAQSVFIGTIRELDEYNQPSERPNVVLFLEE